MIRTATSRIAIIVFATSCSFAQLPSDKTHIQLGIDFFDSYGAKQNFTNALKGQIDNFKKQNPNIPGPIVEAFVINASSAEFFSHLSKPLTEKFTKDELIELIRLHRKNGCQKFFHSNNLDLNSLTQAERKDIEDLRNSEVGIKFSKEWPSLKDELRTIARQWLIDSYNKAVNTSSRNKKSKT